MQSNCLQGPRLRGDERQSLAPDLTSPCTIASNRLRSTLPFALHGMSATLMNRRGTYLCSSLSRQCFCNASSFCRPFGTMSAQTSSMPSRFATLSAADDAQREARGKQANGLGRRQGCTIKKVMAGLGPAIHVLPAVGFLKDVDAPHKAGHDSVGGLHSSWAAWPAMVAQSWVPACAETNREAARPSPSPGPGRCLAVARLRP
jgi:hypothetical protein